MVNQPYKVRGKPHIKAYDVQTGDVTVQCRMCEHQYHVVRVDPEMMEAWIDGKLIQSVMPQLSADDRELLISGTCSSCWESLFGPPPHRSDGSEE